MISPYGKLTTVQVIGRGPWLGGEILIVMSMLNPVLRRHIRKRCATVVVLLRLGLPLLFLMRHVGLLRVVGVAFVLIFDLDQGDLLLLWGRLSVL